MINSQLFQLPIRTLHGTIIRQLTDQGMSFERHSITQVNGKDVQVRVVRINGIDGNPLEFQTFIKDYDDLPIQVNQIYIDDMDRLYVSAVFDDDIKYFWFTPLELRKFGLRPQHGKPGVFQTRINLAKYKDRVFEL